MLETQSHKQPSSRQPVSIKNKCDICNEKSNHVLKSAKTGKQICIDCLIDIAFKWWEEITDGTE